MTTAAEVNQIPTGLPRFGTGKPSGIVPCGALDGAGFAMESAADPFYLEHFVRHCGLAKSI
jgi:hypothetical protein